MQAWSSATLADPLEPSIFKRALQVHGFVGESCSKRGDFSRIFDVKSKGGRYQRLLQYPHFDSLMGLLSPDYRWPVWLTRSEKFPLTPWLATIRVITNRTPGFALCGSLTRK
jgi:hypothetical protein